jgi:uncharacterized protein involved in exopolysaccharide biosynthesis
MNLVRFIKILMKKIIYIIAIPVVVGAIVFFLTKDMPSLYESEATVFTGVTSNSGLSVEAVRVDNFAAQNEYNNMLTILNSNSLKEEVALRLLVQHLMLEKPQKEILSDESYNKLKESVPDDVKKLIVKGNSEKSYQNLLSYIKQDDSNYLYKLLNHWHPHYSLNALSTVKCTRLTTSDVVKIYYSCEDAGVCYNTVKFIADIFIKRYSVIKNSQTSSAVDYFEQKLQEAAKKLEESEDKLLIFNVDNDIINYEEQTKQITTQLEKIELTLQEVKMSFQASQAVLLKIENEVRSRFKINLRNKSVLSIRQDLVDVNNEIAKIELDPSESAGQNIVRLKQQKNRLEEKLETKIDSLYMYESNGQGMETYKLLDQWIASVKEYEESNAKFKSMQIRRVEFMEEFKKFAPLGATLQRYNREIEVNENEYLNTLQHLGLARQKLKNTDMVSNMKIMDAPKMPITSLPSTKSSYIIIAALFSVIFYIVILFLVELMDHSIKNTQRLTQLTGLEIPGAFCIHNNKKFINTEGISEKAAIYLVEKIYEICPSMKSIVIQLLSFWSDEEKKYVAEFIQKKIIERGLTCEILNFSSNAEPNEENQKSEINPGSILQYSSYQELISDKNINADLVINIVDPISEGIQNVPILNTANISFVVFNAGTTWNEADSFNLEKIKKIIKHDIFAVLTYAQPDDLEVMYGEIPKKRSKFRKMIKKNITKYT